MSHEALARRTPLRVEVRYTPHLPQARAFLPGMAIVMVPKGLGGRLSQALAGFPVATLGSADAGPPVQVAEEDTGEYWDWVGYTFLPLCRQR